MLVACMFSGEKMDLLCIWHKYKSWGDNDSRTLSMWKGQGNIGHSKFLSCPLRGFMPTCWGVPQLLDPYIYLLALLFY